MGGWLAHVLGLDNASGVPYLAWSGPGGDIGELAFVGVAIGAYRKHTCHVDRCWRFAMHPVAGTPYRACRRHHPTVPDRISAKHIAEAHDQASRAEQ